MKRYIMILVLLLGWNTMQASGLLEVKGRSGLWSVPDSGLRVQTTIREQVAVTTVLQRFRVMNDGRMRYGFPLSDKATVTSIRWRTGGTWYAGTMHTSDTVAPNGGGGAPSWIFDGFGTSPFIFPFRDSAHAGDTIDVELTYVELLSLTDGRITYALPVIQESGLVDEWTLDIRSERRIADAMEHADIGNGSDDVFTDRTVRIVRHDVPREKGRISCEFRLESDGLRMNVLSTKPADEDGYAIMLAEPASRIEDGDILSKRFTFVLDVSGSMSGAKIGQAREAAIYCLQHLNVRDKVNVITFSSAVRPWKTEHVDATPQAVEQAIDYVQKAEADGGTNIMGALVAALQQYRNADDVNVIVFLTDGQATVDQRAIVNANRFQTRIFVFGVGDNVDEPLLTELATRNNGGIEIIRTVGNTLDRIAALYNHIRNPIVKNPILSFTPDVVYDVHPLVVPDVYEGEQIVLAGRYSQPGENTVTVRGTDTRGPVEHTFAARLTDDSTMNLFVPKLWARFRITDLLVLMEKEVKDSDRWKEWRDEIIRLGLRHAIVTPFTTYEDNGQPDDGNDGGGDDGGQVLSVEEQGSDIITTSFVCRPNPVSTEATLSLVLPEGFERHVTIELMDLAGRTVRTLYEGSPMESEFVLQWQAVHTDGLPLSPGVYFLRVRVGSIVHHFHVHVVR